MKIISKTLTWLAGALLLLAAGIAFMFWSYQNILDASSQRAQTREVIREAKGLLLGLKDAEAAQRGFALTGNEAYLPPYLAVRDTIPAQFQTTDRTGGLEDWRTGETEGK